MKAFTITSLTMIQSKCQNKRTFVTNKFISQHLIYQPTIKIFKYRTKYLSKK